MKTVKKQKRAYLHTHLKTPPPSSFLATWLAALSTATLCSCSFAGVTEMRAETPFATFTSKKTMDSVTACVSESWTLQKIGFITPDVRTYAITGGEQVMIYNSTSASPDAFSDFLVEVGGISVNYYAKNLRKFKVLYRDLIPPCL